MVRPAASTAREPGVREGPRALARWAALLAQVIPP